MYTRNDLIHLSAHLIVDSLAVIANILLLISIRKRTPSSMRAYSILITNTAIIDIISAVAGFLACSRLLNAPDDTSIFVFLGPCYLRSREFCLLVHAIQANSLNQSTWFILLSFCYRLYILEDVQSNGHVKYIWTTCAATLFYSAASIYIYYGIGDAVRPGVAELLGIQNYTAVEFPRVDTAYAAAAILPTALISPTLTISIYFIRRVLVRKIKRVISSDTSRASHNNIAKTLTYQSLLPVGGFIGTTYWSLDKYFGLSSELPQRLVMIINPIPIAAPVINLLCLPPYRKWIMFTQRSNTSVSRVSDLTERTR